MPVATKPKRIVHQKAKGPIDPGVGQKVRELRTSRGMTQAALAGPDFSKGFISLLETGRTRISLRAAHVLAARLGVEVTDLLSAPTTDRQDLEFMLLRAEQELRAGQTKTTMEIAAKWTSKASGILRARFQRLQARALIETTRSPEAVQLLDEALRAFRSLGAKAFAARTLYDLARAHMRVGAPGEAVRYALQSEHAIERGDVIDRTLELEIHQFLASIYYGLGDVASAQIRSERARAIAEDAADPAALAKLYGSLALTRYEEGDKEAALAYARKSIEAHDALGQHEKVAETWNTLGWLFIKRAQYGKAADARELAEKAVDLDGPRLKARALLLRARAIASAGGSLAEVRRAFDEAIAAHKGESPREQARAHQAYGDALAERKQAADAYAEARKASELAGVHL